MWRAEKTEYLRSNRDYGDLLGDEHGGGMRSKHMNNSDSRGGRQQEKKVSQDRQEYLDRRQKLKELERQKMKQKLGFYGAATSSNDLSMQDDIVPSKNKERIRIDPGQSHSKPKHRALPYDRSFGSFFGPSEPVVARRIIEEARAREEAEMVAARAHETEEIERHNAPKARSGHSGGTNLKSSGDIKSSRYMEEQKVAKPVDEITRKAQKLRETRDYSFLFSGADPVSDTPQQSKPLATVKEASTKTQASGDQQVKEVGRSSSPPSRKRMEMSKVKANQEVLKKMQTKSPSDLPKKQSAGPEKVSSSKPGESRLPLKPKSLSGALTINRSVSQSKAENKPKESISSKQISDSREQSRKITLQDSDSRQVSKKVTGPGQPSYSSSSSRLNDQKHGVNRISTERNGRTIAALDRQKVAVVGREAATVQKPPPAKVDKLYSSRIEDKGRRIPENGLKKPASNSKPETALEKSAPFKSNQFRRPNVSLKRRARDSDEESEDSFFVDDEEEDARGGGSGVFDYIRKMFRYNPNKYRDDDGDDRDMEVGFSRIQAEERRSARIAREEDEREALLIEEEERAERMRKLKKLKASKR